MDQAEVEVRRVRWEAVEREVIGAMVRMVVETAEGQVVLPEVWQTMVAQTVAGRAEIITEVAVVVEVGIMEVVVERAAIFNMPVPAEGEVVVLQPVPRQMLLFWPDQAEHREIPETDMFPVLELEDWAQRQQLFQQG
jgi:hypothetical protein